MLELRFALVMVALDLGGKAVVGVPLTGRCKAVGDVFLALLVEDWEDNPVSLVVSGVAPDKEGLRALVLGDVIFA